MSYSLMIHLIFKKDVTEEQVETLTTALDGSDNIRVYDYGYKSIQVMVLDRSKINDQVFAQLAAVLCCRVTSKPNQDSKNDNVYVFVDFGRLNVDTSPTANAVKNLF